MPYEITIANKLTDYLNNTPKIIDLQTVSPSLFTNPDVPIDSYNRDMETSDKSIYIPLYKRTQYVKLEPDTTLLINTDNVDEAVYYRNLNLSNTITIVNPDPIDGDSPTPPGPTPILNESLPVRFLDYDGTVLYTFTADDFSSLTELPANPQHEGLTAQGWNYSLEDAKDYVNNYGSLDVGQTYITSDGKTRIHIRLSDGRLEPTLGLVVDGSVVVDWGDGSEPDTIEGDSFDTIIYRKHIYISPGEYVITLDVDGYFSFRGSDEGSRILVKSVSSSLEDSVYRNSIVNIYLGTNFDTTIETYTFNACYSLESITMPENIEYIGEDAFRSCRSLKSITLPAGTFTLSSNTFVDCYSLTSITIPIGVEYIEPNTFEGCFSLKSVAIPEGTSEVESYAFTSCSSLTSVIIPNSVTSIGHNAFTDCRALTSITIPEDVTIIDYDTFYGCISLESVEIQTGATSIKEKAFSNCSILKTVTIPNSVTSIENMAFRDCSSLTSVVISNSATSIGTNAFYYCYSLASVTIPGTVTSIGAGAFTLCSGIGYIRFESSNPPTIANANAWDNVPTDCILYVPASVSNSYMNGTNYPSKATYTYIGYATYESGETLPSTTADGTYTLTWYTTSEDAMTQTNPITVGNGNEVYSRAVAV